MSSRKLLGQWDARWWLQTRWCRVVVDEEAAVEDLVVEDALGKRAAG